MGKVWFVVLLNEGGLKARKINRNLQAVTHVGFQWDSCGDESVNNLPAYLRDELSQLSQLPHLLACKKNKNKKRNKIMLVDGVFQTYLQMYLP